MILRDVLDTLPLKVQASQVLIYSTKAAAVSSPLASPSKPHSPLEDSPTSSSPDIYRGRASEATRCLVLDAVSLIQRLHGVYK